MKVKIGPKVAYETKRIKIFDNDHNFFVIKPLLETLVPLNIIAANIKRFIHKPPTNIVMIQQ